MARKPPHQIWMRPNQGFIRYRTHKLFDAIFFKHVYYFRHVIIINWCFNWNPNVIVNILLLKEQLESTLKSRGYWKGWCTMFWFHTWPKAAPIWISGIPPYTRWLIQCWATVYDAGPTLKRHWINSSCLLWISCLTPAVAGQSQEWVEKVGDVVWNCSRVSVCLPNKHETLNWCCFNGIKTASAQIIVVAWCRLAASGVFILSLLSAGGTGPPFYLPLSLVSTSPDANSSHCLLFK